MPDNELIISRQVVEKYSQVRNVLGDMVRLSQSLIRQTEGQKVESELPDLASRFFIKQVLHAEAVLKIAPDFLKTPGEPQRLDPASIAVLTRAVLEAYLRMHHLCIEPLSSAERAFRMDLWNYHDIKTRLKGRRHIDPKDPDLPQFEHLTQNVLEKLQAREEFISLKDGEQQEIRRGKKAMILPLEKIAKRAGIHPTRYHDAYVHLSSFSHGGPMALARLRDFYFEQDTIVKILRDDLQTTFLYLCLGYLDFENLVSPMKDIVPEAIRAKMLHFRQELSTPL